MKTRWATGPCRSAAQFSLDFVYATLAYVVDGDTIRLRGGAYVRLVQIDAPETYHQHECYGERATRALNGVS